MTDPNNIDPSSIQSVLAQLAENERAQAEPQLTSRQRRARTVARGAAVITLLAFVAAGVWLSALPGHAIVGQAAMDGPSNPLAKQVTVQAGAWLANQQAHPLLWLVPGLAALGMLGVIVLRNRVAGFISSCLAVAGVILTAGIALFPFLMPSSVQPAHGLTVWDASSSARTLGIMLFAAAVFLPLILAYSTWAFRIMRGQVTRAHVEEQARNGGGY